MTPAIQAGHWGHGRAEASWSNSLLPPAVTLHCLPTGTLFLPATAEEEAACGISDCKDTSPSPHCSTPASPPPLPCVGPKPGHRQNSPGHLQGRRGSKDLLLALNSRIHWIRVPHTPSWVAPPRGSSELILGGTKHLLSGAGLEGVSTSSCTGRRKQPSTAPTQVLRTVLQD